MEERQGAPDPPGLSVGPALHNHDVKTVAETVATGGTGMTAVMAGTERSQVRLISVNTLNNSTRMSVSGESRLGANVSNSTGDSVSSARFSPLSSAQSPQSDGAGPARKRLKLGESGEKQVPDDVPNLRRKLLEYKNHRIKTLKEKHMDYLYEMFYLQIHGGSMLEFPSWRKRPATPQLVNYLKAHRLDALEEDDASRSFSQGIHISHSSVTSSTPQGAEIKIPGVGVTPVAVSTQLPAAVAQLTQQGSVPGRPAGGRHGMVFAPHRSQSSLSTPRLPGGTPLVVENSGVISRTSINHAVSAGSSPAVSTSQEQIVEKAKQEAHVMQRVSELQKEGLWTEKRLPKVVEPQRPKVHWDYLLEEMVWLAADFAQERKWKKAAAKKCARMVQKYFQEKAYAAQRAERAQELQMRKIASFIAKEIKTFWCNVEKLVEFKQQTRLEEKRKEALDQQLNFIVGQTEKYSLQLAEGMRSHSKQTSSKGSTTSACQSDDEFCPSGARSSDDEETIAAAEKEDNTNSHKDEIEALHRESQMDLDEFLNELPADYLKNRDKIKLPEDEVKNDEDSEYPADEDSTDDEDTIKEQEKAEGKDDHKQEIDELNADNEMSIEELKKKYSVATVNSVKSPESDDEPESDIESESEEEKSDESDEEEENEGEEVEEGLNALVNDKIENNCEGQDVEDVAAIAESIQPKGNTFSTTQVVTKVPFLLKHSLREYQHIGLDWLVTMEQRKLNGILADEMGLGKTIQTIALLAHLACEKGDWGPHLIIVPTSVMLNWEMECKKWCPGFKILTYYGSQKERKLKRIGWTKPNAFHICITSYTLVIQDHQSFRRKKWKYLILDEAQNIKNFKSQRWQLLLNFQTQQRLLLTGTPLQNNLMELWSLMHFLMPDVFASHKEFKEWFSNPVTGMIEGNSEYNENIIKRLHKVLRPFLLRRLKSEVEKQMPKKYEHIIMCRLSKRQRFLYEDFMSRTKTKETLASGNLLSVINVLMQLRKVCNHPNLFEVRPIISPFQMDPINLQIPSLVYNVLTPNPLTTIDLTSLNLNLLYTERRVSAFEAHRVRSLQTKKHLIEQIDEMPPSPPPLPKAALHINVSIRQVPTSTKLSFPNSVMPGTSPRVSADNSLLSRRNIRTVRPVMRVPPLQSGEQGLDSMNSPLPQSHMITRPITPLIAKQLLNAQTAKVLPMPIVTSKPETEHRNEFYQPTIQEILKNRRKTLLSRVHDINQNRCNASPLYGIDLRETCTIPDIQYCPIIKSNVPTIEKYMENLQNILKRFVFYIAAAMSPGIRSHVSHGIVWKVQEDKEVEISATKSCKPFLNLLHPVKMNMMTHFPDPRLIQYDCGKLQTLDLLLRNLKTEQHRVLIFTQMTKMLDVLEAFLNFHGYIYLRLDGTTRVEQRQSLMERFNSDPRIFVFILSTRSGGVGINLTGADTVIFYDSDWNPTMDAQAQDRCHRIGQTRDVHIYRLVSEKTIEENILRKAHQKRLLGDVAIEGGNFTTAYFKSSTIQDLFTVSTEEDAAQRMEVSHNEEDESSNSNAPSNSKDFTVFETALAEAEDEADVVATKTARAEAAADLAEFDESIPIEEPSTSVLEQQPELSKAELELQSLMSQLSPVERYAMNLVESSEAAAIAEQQATAEMERQKRDWEAARKLLERPPTPPDVEMNDDLLTFSREDAINQMWLSEDLCHRMPMWCPPTPPQGDEDVFIDKSLGYLYDTEVMSESQLPPVYVRRENKRPRTDLGHSPDSRRSLKIHRKEESVYAPRSLFERPSVALLKMRRDLKLQKYRGIVRPPPVVPLAGIKPPTRPEPDNSPEWTITEDMNLLLAMKYQGLPLNLMIISPAHTPNWDLAADLVNNCSRIYRNGKQCRIRYENVILPREEGKLLYDANQKKQKKNKSSHKSGRFMRTSQLYEQDNNLSFTEAMISKFDTMKFTLNKKTATPKRRYEDPKTSKSESVLVDYNISYDVPPSPMEVAAMKVDRIAKEKQKSSATPASTTTTPATASDQVVTNVRIPGVKPTPSPPPGALGTPTVTSVVTPLRTPQRMVQADTLQRTQRIVVTPHVTSVVAKGSPVGTIAQSVNQTQMYLRQQTLARQMKVFHQHPNTSVAQGTVVQQIGVAQPVTGNKTVPVTVSTIQMSASQARPQITQTLNVLNKPTSVGITRTVSDADINALLKRNALVQQKGTLQQPVTQIFASQQQLQAVQGSSGERVTVSVNTGGVNVATGGIKTTPGILTGVSATAIPGKSGMKMTTSQHLHQLKFQQQVALVQRKGQKVTQVGNAPQLIVQGATGAHKTLPGMTVQHLQVMRQVPQAGGTRVIPRQTIQVVSNSTMNQVRTAGGTTGHPTQVILSQVSSAALRQPNPLNRQQITQITHQQTQQQAQQQQQQPQQSDAQTKPQ